MRTLHYRDGQPVLLGDVVRWSDDDATVVVVIA